MTWSLEDAYKHLHRDPVMKRIIKSTGRLEHGKSGNLYRALIRAIAGQQLSTKAGETIHGRFLDLFPRRDPKPELVIKMKADMMRKAGFSYSKAEYVKNIAKFSIEKTLDNKKLSAMEDEELIEYLTSIKGVGRWTAEMILMFTLNRPDILPVDDLGIRQSMKSVYKIDCDGKKLVNEMLEIGKQWQPFRTLASRHLWRYRDLN